MGRYADGDIKHALIDETTAAENVIVAAVAGKILRVLAFNLVTTLANVVTFRSDTDDMTGAIPLGANGILDAPYAEEGHFQTAVAEDIRLNATVATAHGGWLTYVEI